MVPGAEKKAAKILPLDLRTIRACTKYTVLDKHLSINVHISQNELHTLSSRAITDIHFF